MNCDQFVDSFELYAIGALDAPDAEALRSHLAGGCEVCARRVNQALMEAAFISGTVPMVEPPKHLRERVVATVGRGAKLVAMPGRKRILSSLPWLVAAAAAAALIIGISMEDSSRRAERMTQAADAERTAQMLNIMQAPGTRQVVFRVNQADVPRASLFIHKNLGVAMVVAHLPAAPSGWKYESWVMPKAGAPRAVESFATNDAGVAITVVKGPVDVTQWAALGVSMEPADSNPVKPTKMVFSSPV